MMHVDMNSAWRSTISSLLRRGATLPSRDGQVKELLDYSLTLMYPQNNFVFHPQRKLSPTYAAAELLWYMSGNHHGEMILRYAPSYKRFLNPQGFAHGGYGPRLTPWLEKVIRILRDDKNSRQAVIPIFEHRDIDEIGTKACKDIPCTLNLQFMIRDDKLHLFVNMRSNDAWLGLPYDVFCFTSIQRLVAGSMGIELGPYHHHVASMHLYERDFEKAKPVEFLFSEDDEQGWYPTHTDTPFLDIHKAVEIEDMLHGKDEEMIRSVLASSFNNFTLGYLCAALCLQHKRDFQLLLPENIQACLSLSKGPTT